MVIYHNNETIQELSVPTGTMSIAYAELFAIYTALKWVQKTSLLKEQDIHFFVDSKFARDSLCSTVIPKKLFFLIQDIKHLAGSIRARREIFIHWIPSHLDRYTQGQYYIPGNQRADQLAEKARDEARDFLSSNR